MIKTIIAFLFVFGVIVIIHEFGHFYFAKCAGILVKEFAIGMGPKVFQVRKGETVYTLRLLPVGGYVRMAGHEEDDQDIKPGMMVTLRLEDGMVQQISFDSSTELEQGIPFQIESCDLQDKMEVRGYKPQKEELEILTVSKTATIIEEDGTEVVVAPIERQFNSASLKDRMLTNFAGPMNNFEAVVGNFASESAAQVAGLQVGDKIIEIEGQRVQKWGDISKQISPRADLETKLVIERNGTQQTVVVTPKAYDLSDGSKVGILGIESAKKTDVLSKILYGFTQTWFVISSVFLTIASFFTKGFSINQLGGPVAIFSLTSQVAQSGFISILNFLGLISANLGMMNLLPIPALDGGKLVLNIIEGIRKKPLSPEKESYITIAGAVFLIILMILVTWNDISKLF